MSDYHRFVYREPSTMVEAIQEAALTILRSECTIEYVPARGEVTVTADGDVTESQLQEMREWLRDNLPTEMESVVRRSGA